MKTTVQDNNDCITVLYGINFGTHNCYSMLWFHGVHCQLPCTFVLFTFYLSCNNDKWLHFYYSSLSWMPVCKQIMILLRLFTFLLLFCWDDDTYGFCEKKILQLSTHNVLPRHNVEGLFEKSITLMFILSLLKLTLL